MDSKSSPSQQDWQKCQQGYADEQGAPGQSQMQKRKPTEGVRAGNLAGIQGHSPSMQR